MRTVIVTVWLPATGVSDTLALTPGPLKTSCTGPAGTPEKVNCPLDPTVVDMFVPAICTLRPAAAAELPVESASTLVPVLTLPTIVAPETAGAGAAAAGDG